MSTTSSPCDGCRNGEALDFSFSMAFQPIVDLHRALGVRYIQGFLFAKPAFEALPVVSLSLARQARSA